MLYNISSPFCFSLSSSQHLSAEIKEFKDKLDRFHKVQHILAENNKAGNTEELADKATKLHSDWTKSCEVAQSSLDVLLAEHKEWVREMVEEMETMVRQGTELLQLELNFIECYPMMTILDANPSALIEELTRLTNSQVQHENCDIVCDISMIHVVQFLDCCCCVSRRHSLLI